MHDPQSLNIKNDLIDDFIQNVLKKDITTQEQILIPSNLVTADLLDSF
jgi:hypothetical protein